MVARQGLLVGRCGVFVPQGKAGQDPFGQSDDLQVTLDDATVGIINAIRREVWQSSILPI